MIAGVLALAEPLVVIGRGLWRLGASAVGAVVGRVATVRPDARSVVVAGAVLAAVALVWRLDALGDARDRARADVERLERSLAAERALRAAREDAMLALGEMLARLELRADAADDLREKVMHAPDGDDGPVQPVLADALERLRGRDGDGPDE